MSQMILFHNVFAFVLLPTCQAVDYTTFNKASHISQGSLDYFITYGPDRLRKQASHTADNLTCAWDWPNKNFAGFQGEDFTRVCVAIQKHAQACALERLVSRRQIRAIENKKFLFSLDFFVLFYQEKRTKTDYRNTEYADNGNITNRSDIGDYAYTGVDAGPHAFTGLSNTVGNLLPATSQTVDYTAFNKASHISQGSLDYFITYGPDRLRRKTTLLNGATDDVLLTKYYAFGDYERETDATGTRHLHYISAGDGLAAVYVKNEGGSDSLYFILKDHLRSIVAAINNETGKVYRQSFDAWGRNRNPENWTYSNIPNFIFDRGYTGHEQLKWFGLINMNGRMYDAALCRFLSPDPFVQMPDYSQNFNRYSYALNNPLVYTDPSGEFIFTALLPGVGVFLDAMCWGAVIGGGIGGVRGALTEGMTFWDGAWRGAVVGAVGGLMGPMGGAGMSFVENLGVGAIQGAFTGGLDATLWGTDVGQGMLWGAAGGMAFATLTSQNLKNATKGKGFKTNSKVFDDFRNGIYTESGEMWQNDVLDYFDIDANYSSTKLPGADYVLNNDSYFGSTNPSTGRISIGDEAFTSYDNLIGQYNKELFTQTRVLNSEVLATWDNHGGIEELKRMKYFPEEALGFKHAFKNNGLYPKSTIKFMTQSNAYWSQVYTGSSLVNGRAWYNFIYKIPRRW